MSVSETHTPLRVVLAEDDEALRSLLAQQLDSDCRINLCATARNGIELLAYIDHLDLDLAVIDVEMPLMDGIHVVREIRKRSADIPIAMLTAFERKSRLMEAISAGAQGFLTKDMPTGELVDALLKVASGQDVMSSAAITVASEVLKAVQRRSEDGHDWSERVQLLAEKHRPVYDLLIQGFGNQQIAREAHLSEGTVRTYVSEILALLKCQSRSEVIRHASLAETVDIPL